MAKQPHSNPNFDKEKAEGDRKTVDEALGGVPSEERQDKTGAKPRADIPGHEQQGITNHPKVEEDKEQSDLPPRGEAKKPTPGGHA
jgi:hypothetical protein